MIKTKVVKKNNSVQNWDNNKIISAVMKSAERANVVLSDKDKERLIEIISDSLSDKEYINVKELHNVVEQSLYKINESVAKSYIEYRNYKLQFVKMMDEVYRKKLELNDVQDASNANSDSSLVTTQKAITYSELNGELYKRFFLTDEERNAMMDGYIYIHDRGSRLDATNCCLFDMRNVFSGGFEMGNMHYNEPKSIGVAFSVMLDVIFNAGSSQYGGFTVSEVDKLLAKYAEKSYNDYYDEYFELTGDKENSEERALNKLKREIEQHVQAMEMKLNSCETSRGDYIFTSISFGLSENKFGQLISSAILKVRKEGQGRDGYKRPVLFPKLTFLYDENLHGKGKELEWLFLEAVDCTMKSQYPDFLSMSGDGYAPSIYKKYGVTISRMGCVSGKHLVTYREKGSDSSLTSSFEGVWNILSQKHPVSNLNPTDPISSDFIELEDIEVLDVNRFVDCKRIIRNPTRKDWYRVTLDDNQAIYCTRDHYWTVNNQYVVQTTDLKSFDKIPTVKDGKLELVRIKEVKYLCEYEDYSYDFSTSSEHFNCDSIRSHNCRANLSPWYEKGGQEPLDEADHPIYEGRFNCGAISLHFPMIVAKAKEEGKDFFEVLEYYLQLARKIHIRTIEFLSHKKAGINPLAFCQGGFYNGNKKPDEELGREFFRPSTVSFGITALNEATVMYNGKTIYEDKSEFAEKVLKYVNDFANKYKKEDGILYAIYGTPGESLLPLMVKQFRKKYGVIKGVSDREYMSNSFHMHVAEDITPIDKQDAEYKCFHLCNGGNIIYNRFNSEYNKESFVSLIRRAMKLGYYYGCNQSKDYCKDCGKEFVDLDKCPGCGSENIVRIERVCGYLGMSRVGDKTRMNDGKLEEIKDRKCM